MTINFVTTTAASIPIPQSPPSGDATAISKIAQTTLATPAATSSAPIKVTSPEDADLTKAKKYGYKGTDLEEAKAYLIDLRDALFHLLTPSLIGMCYAFVDECVDFIQNDGNKILNAEQTLEGIFDKINETQIYQLIISLVHYSSHHSRIRNALHGPSLAPFLSELLRIKEPSYFEESQNAKLVEKACVASSKMQAIPSMPIILMMVLRANQNQLCLDFVCQEKDLDLLKLFVEEGVISLSIAPAGRTPLHTAAACGNSQMVKWILEKGAEIEAKNFLGNTPLHTAFQTGNIDAIETLLLRGANLHATNKNGKRPFDLSNSQSFAFYLEKFPHTEIPKSFNRQEILFHACARGYSKAVQVLLNNNVPADQVLPEFEFTPIDWALAHGQFQIVQQILAHFGCSYEVYLEDKFLAHVFEVRGSSNLRRVHTHYEGFHRELASHRLSAMAALFLEEPNVGLMVEEKIAIKAAFQAAPDNLSKKPEELVADIQAGKPVVLFAGWNTHITGILFYKSRVLKCNRGRGAGSKPGIEVFRMTKTDSLLSVVRDLQILAKKEEGERFFLFEMNVKLGLVKEFIIRLNTQAAGNCGWATSEALFVGLNFVLLHATGVEANGAITVAIDICNRWIQFVRNKSFHGYIAKVAFDHRDRQLLDFARKKLQNPVSISA